MSGYLAISRAVFDDPRLPTPNHQAAWLALLLNARWPEGEVAGTWNALASRLGWNEFSAKRCLRFFDGQNMIALDADGYRYRLRILDQSHIDLARSSGNGEGTVAAPYGRTSKGKPVFGAAREPIADAVRKMVFARHGEVCAYCATTDGPFEIDHIVPIALGGGNDLKNLTVACAPCNRSKGAQTLKKWRAS